MTTTALGARLSGVFALGVLAHAFAGLVGALVVAMLGVAVFLHWSESQR